MRRWTAGADFRAGALGAPDGGGDAPTPAEEQIAAWLARLRLLYGVPFHYLVPNARMLPVESIRFFRVDDRWVTALVDGAFSLGRPVTGVDAAEAGRLARVHEQARRLAPRLRAARLGLPAADELPRPMSGFLLRSAVVGGWPALEVEALDADGGTLVPLRLERLSPEVLLGIFAGVVRRVKFREPAEMLHFGVLPGTDPPLKALK
jgi:hypothetical protein